MAKLLFLVTSDLHYHDWNKFNADDYRLKATEKYLKSLIKISHKNRIPILFGGDFSHTPEGLTTKVIFRLLAFLRGVCDEYPNFLMLGIDGNHDTSYELSQYKPETPTLFKALSFAFPKNIISINFTHYQHYDIRVYGIPYLVHNMGFKKTYQQMINDGYKGDKVLLIHTNLLGAMDPSGFRVKEMDGIPNNMGKFFSPFRLVLSGHIHKHADLYKGRIFSIGAPNQQRQSDLGCDMGYMEIYDDFSTKLVSSRMPEFKLYRKDSDIKDDGNFWVKIPEEKNLMKREKGVFTVNTSRVKLAKKYCRKNNIKSKRRIRELVKVLHKSDEL